MRSIRFALAAASLSFVAASVMAAVPVAPGTAPASAAAVAPAPVATTAPATMSAEELAAKQALKDFFLAMFKGDQATAFGLLTYSDLDAAGKGKNQATAEAMFNEILAEQRLRMAVNGAFPADKAKTFETGMGEDEINDFTKSMDAATAKLNDKKDGANVQLGLGSTFVMTLKGNKWLVDFDKTQTNMGPMPNKDAAALTEMAAGYNQIAKDVADKKFATVDDVTKAVDKVEAPATAPKGPETQPK